MRRVECDIRHLSNIFIPSAVTFSPRPHHSENTEDALDDWNADISAIVEWVGMACLGAQR